MIPWFEFKTASIGFLTVQVWGFFVALGIIIGVLWLLNRIKKEKIQEKGFLDFVTWILLGAFIGARVVHIVFYEPSFYLSNPFEIIKVWHGGLSSFGGFIGAAVSALIFSKKRGMGWLNKVSKKDFLNLGTLPFLTGWIVGRVGCVMIHDHPGMPCNCMLSLNHPDKPFLDMALLEILGLLPLLLVLILGRKNTYIKNNQFPILLVYYGLLRFILDFYRVIDTRVLGLTPGQYLSILMLVAGARLLKTKKKN